MYMRVSNNDMLRHVFPSFQSPAGYGHSMVGSHFVVKQVPCVTKKGLSSKSSLQQTGFSVSTPLFCRSVTMMWRWSSQ